MSEIKQLIERLCPDGVEYKRLGEVCEIKGRIGFRGYTRKDIVEESQGAISLSPSNIINGNLKYDKCTYVSWDKYNESPEIMAHEGDIIFTKTASVGKTALIKELPKEATINPQLVLLKNIQCNNSFLSYILKGDKFQNDVRKITGVGSVPNVPQSSLASIEIPVPPLEVQRKIVEVLDNFTELEVELEVELEAELEARRKQYEYYRNTLLSFDKVGGVENNVKWMTLGEIAEIGTGSSNTNEELDEGKYPFFVRSQVVRYKNEYEYDETAIITSGDGVGVGKVFHYIEGKYALHQRAYRIKIKTNKVNSKFFYYYMRTTFYNYIMKNAYSSSVTSVRKPMLIKFPVPIPPLSEQQRIVSILDRFEALTTDLQKGLPAEIAARRKQYEYYREKLLTFKRKTA